MQLPEVVSREEWVKARLELLEKEKEVTRARDMINDERQKLPMVKVEKNYVFVGPDGNEVSLLDLFDGRRQLIVRHFMFAPDEDEGCIGCSMQADSVGALEHIWAQNTTFVMVSRAPQEKLQAFAERMGWDIPWFTVLGDDFNIDYEVTTDKGDSPGVSSFIQDDEGQVYHTYSVYDRGGEIFKNFYNYLDTTYLGRGEDKLEHPWDWWRHKDRYNDSSAAGPGDNWWNGTRFQS